MARGVIGAILVDNLDSAEISSDLWWSNEDCASRILVSVEDPLVIDKILCHLEGRGGASVEYLRHNQSCTMSGRCSQPMRLHRHSVSLLDFQTTCLKTINPRDHLIVANRWLLLIVVNLFIVNCYARSPAFLHQ